MFHTVVTLREIAERFGTHFPGLRPYLKNLCSSVETDLEDVQTRLFELEKRIGLED